MFTLVMFVVLLGAWWMMSRSTKKQQQERQNTLDSMKPGDHAVTIGGLHGEIAEVNGEEKTVTLDCEGVLLVFDRQSIRTISPQVEAAEVVVETPAVETETLVEESETLSEETTEDNNSSIG
ncbi:MAG: preprotein translocase subunit YajC [Enterococcus sp.]